MNFEEFKKQLNTLSDSDWENLFQGSVLNMLSDEKIKVTTEKSPYMILNGTDFSSTSPMELKQKVMEQQDSIFNKYYQTHPLTEEYFNKQAKQLIKKYGAASFVASEGLRSQRTFFIENGEVIAESATSPKYPYGVYFELDKKVTDKDLTELVNNWIQSNKAYQDYGGMNICRYNC